MDNSVNRIIDCWAYIYDINFKFVKHVLINTQYNNNLHVPLLIYNDTLNNQLYMAFARTIGSNTTIDVFDKDLNIVSSIPSATREPLVYTINIPQPHGKISTLLYYRGDNNKGAYYSLEKINQNNFNPSIDNNISQCCFLINQSNDFNLLLIRTINSDTFNFILRNMSTGQEIIINQLQSVISIDTGRCIEVLTTDYTKFQ